MAKYHNALRAKGVPESINIPPISNKELVNNYENSNDRDPSRRLINHEIISKIDDGTADENIKEYASAVYRILHN